MSCLGQIEAKWEASLKKDTTNFCYAILEKLSTKITNLFPCEGLATCILRNQSKSNIERELCIITWTYIHEDN